MSEKSIKSLSIAASMAHLKFTNRAKRDYGHPYLRNASDLM